MAREHHHSSSSRASPLSNTSLTDMEKEMGIPSFRSFVASMPPVTPLQKALPALPPPRSRSSSVYSQDGCADPRGSSSSDEASSPLSTSRRTISSSGPDHSSAATLTLPDRRGSPQSSGSGSKRRAADEVMEIVMKKSLRATTKRTTLDQDDASYRQRQDHSGPPSLNLSTSMAELKIASRPPQPAHTRDEGESLCPRHLNISKTSLPERPVSHFSSHSDDEEIPDHVEIKPSLLSFFRKPSVTTGKMPNYQSPATSLKRRALFSPIFVPKRPRTMVDPGETGEPTGIRFQLPKASYHRSTQGGASSPLPPETTVILPSSARRYSGPATPHPSRSSAVQPSPSERAMFAFQRGTAGVKSALRSAKTNCTTTPATKRRQALRRSIRVVGVIK
ncbi:MAG: hypothetical protein M1838_004324, partial [Thelocarpon superellum]